MSEFELEIVEEESRQKLAKTDMAPFLLLLHLRNFASKYFVHMVRFFHKKLPYYYVSNTYERRKKRLLVIRSFLLSILENKSKIQWKNFY